MNYPTERDTVTLPGDPAVMAERLAVFPGVKVTGKKDGVTARLPKPDGDFDEEPLVGGDIVHFEPGEGFRVDRETRRVVEERERRAVEYARQMAEWEAAAPEREAERQRLEALWEENKNWAFNAFGNLLSRIDNPTLKAVAELHSPDDGRRLAFSHDCEECSSGCSEYCDYYECGGVEWPCKTIRIVASGVDVILPTEDMVRTLVDVPANGYVEITGHLGRRPTMVHV